MKGRTCHRIGAWQNALVARPSAIAPASAATMSNSASRNDGLSRLFELVAKALACHRWQALIDEKAGVWAGILNAAVFMALSLRF